MKRFTFYLHKGNNIIKLEEPLTMNAGSKMILRNLDVFWNFKNLENEGVINYGADIDFAPGYWTFEEIQKKLKANDVSLKLNANDGTCTVYGEDHSVKLGSLGPLLGFKTNTTIKANTSTKSPDTVNVNNGVRFLTLSCNLVSFSQNYFEENRSQNNACIPVTSTQNLFGTVSHHSSRYCAIPMYNGTFQEIGFFLESNNRQKFDASVLLEVEIY